MRSQLMVSVDVNVKNTNKTCRATKFNFFFQIYTFFCISKEAVTGFLYVLKV